jgi:hypothetical protein
VLVAAMVVKVVLTDVAVTVAWFVTVIDVLPTTQTVGVAAVSVVRVIPKQEHAL